MIRPVQEYKLPLRRLQAVIDTVGDIENISPWLSGLSADCRSFVCTARGDDGCLNLYCMKAAEKQLLCVCLCVYTVYVQYLKVQGCSLVAATKVVVFLN